MAVMTGSEIAKGGFDNEWEIISKFNNWKADADAQAWLRIMMYDLAEIVSVKAEKPENKYKSDVNVVINVSIVKKNKVTMVLSVENIQVKLVTGDNGFNQVEKKRVEQYKTAWHMPDDIVELLKLYDGELPPRNGSSNPKRMFANEFTEAEQNRLLTYFQDHLVMIVSDIIRGRGRFAAEWTLVINRDKERTFYRWVLISINEAIGFYIGDCKATITPKGNFKLGNVTLQRKGGDNGADTANMLQFKANPLILFNDETVMYSKTV